MLGACSSSSSSPEGANAAENPADSATDVALTCSSDSTPCGACLAQGCCSELAACTGDSDCDVAQFCILANCGGDMTNASCVAGCNTKNDPVITSLAACATSKCPTVCN